MIRGRVYALAAACLGLGAENASPSPLLAIVAGVTLVTVVWSWPRGQGPGGASRQ